MGVPPVLIHFRFGLSRIKPSKKPSNLWIFMGYAHVWKPHYNYHET